MKLGKGICNGTFGELVQGVIDEGPFLITLPIPSLRSEAIFAPDQTISEIICSHSNFKAKEACKKLSKRFGLHIGGHLEIRSNIPVGKGMASSSADVVAAMKAMGHSYSLPLTKEILSSIAVEIEPTDGVMYDGVVAYDYIHGKLIENFGSLPPFFLVGIDVGGMIDTVQFNQLSKPYELQDQRKFFEAYELVKKGFQKRDLSFICKAATISARLNQKILPKPYFHEMEQLANECGGGLVVAHSGTVVGILIDKNLPTINEIVSNLSRQLEAIVKNPNIIILNEQ